MELKYIPDIRLYRTSFDSRDMNRMIVINGSADGIVTLKKGTQYLTSVMMYLLDSKHEAYMVTSGFQFYLDGVFIDLSMYSGILGAEPPIPILQ